MRILTLVLLIALASVGIVSGDHAERGAPHAVAHGAPHGAAHAGPHGGGAGARVGHGVHGGGRGGDFRRGGDFHGHVDHAGFHNRFAHGFRFHGYDDYLVDWQGCHPHRVFGYDDAVSEWDLLYGEYNTLPHDDPQWGSLGIVLGQLNVRFHVGHVLSIHAGIFNALDTDSATVKETVHKEEKGESEEEEEEEEEEEGHGHESESESEAHEPRHRRSHKKEHHHGNSHRKSHGVGVHVKVEV